MAKKPRSQRRGGGGKKGKSSAEDDDANNKLETLSDSHTVDDSVGLSLLEDEYAFDGEFEYWKEKIFIVGVP